MTWEIEHLETIESTNNYIKEKAISGKGEGFVVRANTQSSGRGRGKRIWHSPKGGLYFSTLLAPKNIKRPTDLSILAGLALTQAVKQTLPKQKEVTLKWPNDCLIDWKKVGGILCENLGEEAEHLCVVGIGVNVNLTEEEISAFKGNPFSATSFFVESGGGTFDIEGVFQTCLTKLGALYEMYQTEGFEPIRYLWEKNCHFMGKRVELREVGWQESKEAKVVRGVFSGIDEMGAVIIKNPKGENQVYYSGEVVLLT